MRMTLPLCLMIACGGSEVTLRRGDLDPDLRVTALAITPDAPTTDVPLVAAATTDGPGDDPLSVGFVWSVDGEVVQEGPSSTLEPSFYAKGQVVGLTATASDGRRVGPSVTADPVRILNSPPTFTDLRVTPDAPTSGDVLQCALSDLRDADDDPITVRYAWEVNGARVALDGATLSPGLARKGQVVACFARVDDGEAAGDEVRSAPVTLRNGPPALTAVVIAPQPAFTNSVLSAAATASDPDGDAFSLRWSWEVNGVVVGTQSALPSDRFVRGDTVRATAIVSDGEDDSPALASEPVTIRNAPPTAPVVSLQPSDARGFMPLLCDLDAPSVDADGDRILYVFDFFVDGAPYTGPTTTTLVAGDTVPAFETREGQVWTCRAQAWDRIDRSAWSADSAPVTLAAPIAQIDITLDDLVNQGFDCSSGLGHRYNDCSSAYGFTFEDPNGAIPAAIEIEYEHGLNCTNGTRVATLNDERLGTVDTGPVLNCSCTADAGTWTQSYRFEDLDGFRPSDLNTFLMTATSCEGFSPQPDWELTDGTRVYARILLVY